MSTTDTYHLGRFLQAQEGSFEQACLELRAGRKVGHWMWFVFPQMVGLGASAMAERYAIGSLTEARAYLAHSILGPRLDQVTRLALSHAGTPLRQIFGAPDDLKFCSSMTLFATAAGPDSLYANALQRMCGGRADERTLAMIGRASCIDPGVRH